MARDTTYKKLHFYRGVSYYNDYKYEAALSDLQIWEQHGPAGKNLGSIYALEAKCLLKMKDTKLACQYFDKAIALGYEVTPEELKKCKH